MTAPDRIWAWRKTEQISPDHVRMSYNWIGGQIPKPNHEGTDFLSGYIRADLATPAATDPKVKALVEALETAAADLDEYVGLGYGDYCRAALASLREGGDNG